MTASVARTSVGRTAGHPLQPPTEVHQWTLDAGGITAAVWTYGATVHQVLAPDRDGRRDDVTVGVGDLRAKEGDAHYRGCTVGRFGRCIAGARLPLDGVVYRLEVNEGSHHFHGGPLGFHRFVWQADGEAADGRARVRLGLDRPDGDQGYPGAVAVTCDISLDGAGVLAFEVAATTTAPTVVDVTTHTYWDLSAGADGVDAHLLRVPAPSIIEVGAELLPTGAVVDAAAHGVDLRAGPPLAGVALDTCFDVRGHPEAAVLHHPGSGRTLTITTDQPGLQVYSGDGLPVPRRGICIQPGAWPDAPNQPSFPPARLDPGASYRHRSTFAFSTEART